MGWETSAMESSLDLGGFATWLELLSAHATAMLYELRRRLLRHSTESTKTIKHTNIDTMEERPTKRLRLFHVADSDEDGNDDGHNAVM